MEEFDNNEHEHKTDKEKIEELEDKISNYSWTFLFLSLFLAFKYSGWWILLILLS